MAGRDDVEAVARRLRQRVLERQSGGDVEELFTSMTADGRWPDIDYDGRDLADWAPREHLDRTRRLCRAYPTHALRAVDAWLRLDPQSGNWWHNQLGSPIAFGDALVLLTSYLSDEQRTLGGARLARAVWDKMTAQNLIWAAQAQLRRGVVLDDAAILAAAFDRVKATIFISQDEGIQPDFSFHQHGPLLYFAGYGHDFAVDTAELAFLARDTVFAFAQPLLDILAGYLLDGSQWAVHGHSTYDFTAAGRVIARPSTQDDARLLADAARQLAVAGAGRSAELRAFAARIEGDGAALHGNRHFWCSDYQAHHRAGWSSSVKMTSTRMAPTETGNGEALRSWYLGEGINPVWVSDEDYRDLFPVWDWRQLPGLTAEQADGALPLLDWQGAPDGTLVRGGRDFVGGVSDGRHGMAVMRLAKDAIVDGRKAWFHFDDEIVALGAGIAAPAASAPVYTTLNQTAAAGQWRYAAAFGDVVAGSGTVRDPRWAHHGRIGYVFPTATGPVRLTRESRTGSWRDISHPESADPVRRDVATVAIDHGAAPRSAGYAYIIVPDVDCAQTAEYSESSPISIIANTEAVQAVRHDLLGVTQLAFYQPGRLEVTTALTVSVDAPVLLQITEESDGMSLAAANPRNEPLTVAVGCGAPVRIELPAGEAAGRTVVKKLSRELA